MHLHKPFKRSVEFSVHCVMWVSFLSKFGWKGLMTCLTKILISLWLLNQIGWDFAEMQIISYCFIILRHISSVESQKGVIADQRCSVENQKGAIVIYSDSALLVLNGTSLSCNNALLALNWRYTDQFTILKLLMLKVRLYTYFFGRGQLVIIPRHLHMWLVAYKYTCTCSLQYFFLHKVTLFARAFSKVKCI